MLVRWGNCNLISDGIESRMHSLSGQRIRNVILAYMTSTHFVNTRKTVVLFSPNIWASTGVVGFWRSFSSVRNNWSSEVNLQSRVNGMNWPRNVWITPKMFHETPVINLHFSLSSFKLLALYLCCASSLSLLAASLSSLKSLISWRRCSVVGWSAKSEAGSGGFSEVG